MQQTFLGIEIGGTKLQLITGDGDGSILKRLRFTVNPEAGGQAIQDQIEKAITDISKTTKIDAIGVGFGGPVDWQNGTIYISHQVTGWENFQMKSWLEQLSGVPVAIDNDANVAGYAEAMHGTGKGYRRVFYVTIGSGIGGGFIIDGQIYHGRLPGEMEIGHIRLNKNGATLESQCSGWAVNQLVESFIERNPDSKLASLKSNVPAAYLLKPAVEDGDVQAEAIIDEVSDNIAFGFSHMVHLLNPDIILVGGGLSLIGDPLVSRISSRLPKYLMKAMPLPLLKLASLGEDVVPAGAIELAKNAWQKNNS